MIVVVWDDVTVVVAVVVWDDVGVVVAVDVAVVVCDDVAVVVAVVVWDDVGVVVAEDVGVVDAVDVAVEVMLVVGLVVGVVRSHVLKSPTMYESNAPFSISAAPSQSAAATFTNPPGTQDTSAAISPREYSSTMCSTTPTIASQLLLTAKAAVPSTSVHDIADSPTELSQACVSRLHIAAWLLQCFWSRSSIARKTWSAVCA